MARHAAVRCSPADCRRQASELGKQRRLKRRIHLEEHDRRERRAARAAAAAVAAACVLEVPPRKPAERLTVVGAQVDENLARTAASWRRRCIWTPRVVQRHWQWATFRRRCMRGRHGCHRLCKEGSALEKGRRAAEWPLPNAGRVARVPPAEERDRAAGVAVPCRAALECDARGGHLESRLVQ